MATSKNQLPQEVLAAFERRQPIEAIKLLLSMRAGGSGATKPSATQAPRSKPSEPPAPTASPLAVVNRPSNLAPGEVPSSNSAFWGWVVVALLVYLAFRCVRG